MRYQGREPSHLPIDWEWDLHVALFHH